MLKRAAELDDALTQYNLGVKLETGKGVEKDQSQAFELFLRAAKLGNEAAMRAVAICFERGRGAKKNMQQALLWYRKAAELGDLTAQFNLGVSGNWRQH